MRRHFAPSLDIYFQKKMAHNQDITLDVVGTYFNNHEDQDNRQHDEVGNELLDDQMRQHNHKYSVIGEVAYTKGWQKANLSVGYKTTLAKSDFTISNVLSDYENYDYTTHDDNHYAYAELSGNISKAELSTQSWRNVRAHQQQQHPLQQGSTSPRRCCWHTISSMAC